MFSGLQKDVSRSILIIFKSGCKAHLQVREYKVEYMITLSKWHLLLDHLQKDLKNLH